MLAATSPMGWNSRNMFGASVNADIIKQTAVTFVTSGLRDTGHQYIMIDNPWHGGRRADGLLFPDAPKPMPDQATGMTQTCWWSACAAKAMKSLAQVVPIPNIEPASVFGVCWPRRLLLAVTCAPWTIRP